MVIFAMLVGLMNMLGGRWSDVIGTQSSAGGRFIFRCVLPAMAAGVLSYGHTGALWLAFYVGLAVTAGSALWFPWGWSFDEITGKYDAMKYPQWIQQIGLCFCPLDGTASTNRMRGVIMKGIRGGFDFLTFLLLSAVNPMALAYWPATFLQGAVYWACGRVVGERYAVSVGEISWGVSRGILISIAMGGS